jgi:mRNA-degrading endonuclease RelE of RelBE toxin-antitoxin system
MDQDHYTVVEHSHYIRKAQKVLTDEQMKEIVDIVSKEPDIGEVLTGTGGIRKFRYAGNEGRGKSGGVRIIYLAITSKGIVHLIDIFGKNEKANLSKAERNEMAKVVKLIKGE